MEIIGIPTDSLAPLEPFRTYLLAAVALLILIGIAGGGKIVVKDLIVGELKIGARCAAMLTGIVLAIVFISIPAGSSAGPEPLGLSGWVLDNEKLGTGDVEENRFKIMLVKQPEMMTSVVNNDRSFEFPKSQGLGEGTYTVILFRDDKPVYKSSTAISSDSNGIVIRKFDGENYHLVSQESIVKYLVQRYGNRETGWKERITIIERLVDLHYNEDYKEELVATMTGFLSSDKKSSEYQLALFALGQMENIEVREGLSELMKDESAKIYSRIRAAWLLNDYLDVPQGKDFLMNLIKNGEKANVKMASARYLTRIKNSNQICVIEQLVEGLKNRHREIQALSQETLLRISRGNSNETYNQWAQWFKSNRPRFDAC